MLETFYQLSTSFHLFPISCLIHHGRSISDPSAIATGGEGLDWWRWSGWDPTASLQIPWCQPQATPVFIDFPQLIAPLYLQPTPHRVLKLVRFAMHISNFIYDNLSIQLCFLAFEGKELDKTFGCSHSLSQCWNLD